MFEQVDSLYSFIFAIALTHIFSSVSGLILNRDRVRFSGLLAAWMFSATLSIFINWLGLYDLSQLKHWSTLEILLQLSWIIPQYFMCSLISMNAHGDQLLDMQEFFEKQRPIIFSAVFILIATSMLDNYADRHNFIGWTPHEWINADLIVLPMLIGSVVAGWAHPKWMQWAAVAVTVAFQFWFLFTSYVVPNS